MDDIIEIILLAVIIITGFPIVIFMILWNLGWRQERKRLYGKRKDYEE